MDRVDPRISFGRFLIKQSPEFMDRIDPRISFGLFLFKQGKISELDMLDLIYDTMNVRALDRDFPTEYQAWKTLRALKGIK